MKQCVKELGGFAKFELDHELNTTQFEAIVMKLSMVKVDSPPSTGAEKPTDD